MPLPYFYEENISSTGKTFILSEETSKHCIQVLRMKEGEQLQLTNGRGLMITATIAKEDKRKSEVSINAVQSIEKPERQITIAISLLKNASRFEWFLEKATEIGITEIVPLLCNRTERQHFRYDRMQHILIAAMLQSQQAWLPVLHQPTAFSSFVNNATQTEKLIAHCLETDKRSLTHMASPNNVLMLIGPEGDFTEEEINNCLKQGYTAVTLGSTRLRTEAAGIVAATLLANM